MKNVIYVFVFMMLVSTILIIGCTQNQRAKQFGGKTTIELNSGEKLIEATWKDDEIWYLTRPMRDGEEAETYEFKEKSSFGILEGTVVFKEKK